MAGSWLFWALLSAGFAASTAILAKIGIAGINTDLAILIRTLVVVVFLVGIVQVTGQWQPPASISPRSWIFLGLSGLATGLSWLSYFRALKLGDASRVAPVDKLSIVLVALLGVTVLGEKLSLFHWAGVAMIAAGALVLAVF
nr:EamA family transporter [uncultured Gellertiella sp.]